MNTAKWRRRRSWSAFATEAETTSDGMISYVIGQLWQRPLLRRGSSGTAVGELQRQLNRQGARLVVDGLFGPATESVVIGFQRARGLRVDGIVGPETWGALLGPSVQPPPASGPGHGAGTPFIWPLGGPITITSPYGPRINQVTQQPQIHSGIDLRAAEGTPVRAVADGTVQVAEYGDPINGNWVYLAHPTGHRTAYLHLSTIRVNDGQTVRQGDVIGLSGATGRVTGPHLHFQIELPPGNHFDPLTVLPPAGENRFEGFFDDDADRLVTRRLDGWRRDRDLPVVDQIPARFRNIAFGEISRATPGGERRGMADLQQGALNPQARNIATTVGGRPVLVTHDDAGRLYVRVFDRRTRRVLWAGQLAERVTPPVTEQAVQRVVGAAFGNIRFAPHSERDRGADLIPAERAIARRAANAGRPAAPRRIARAAPVRRRARTRPGLRFDDDFDWVD